MNPIQWLQRLTRPAGSGRRFADVFRYARRALALAWTTSRGLTVMLAALTLALLDVGSMR